MNDDRHSPTDAVALLAAILIVIFVTWFLLGQ